MPVDAPPAVAAPAPQPSRPDAAPRLGPPKNPGGAFRIDPSSSNVSGDRATVVGQAPKTQSPPVNVPPSAKPRPAAPKSARAKKAADPAAIATQRLVTRELGEFLPPNAKDRTSDPASTMN
jgi:hypothetical protein